MPKVDQLVNNFAVNEDAVDYIGIAEIEFPELAWLVEEIKGAGLSGNIEAVVIGHLEAMTAKFSFRTVTPAAVKMNEPRIHNLDCRVSQQGYNRNTGQHKQEALKHILRTMPKKLAVGKAAVASTADASGEHAVYYYAIYRDGKKETELDPVNFICLVNGVDYLAEVRKALGK